MTTLARASARELVEALALERSAEDHVQRCVEGCQSAPRGGDVRGLRVVDVADAVDLGHELEPVRHAGERRERLRDLAVADAAGARCSVAAAAFSRLCAPGISGSAGRSSSAENSTLRPAPGIGPKPRGTTATSSAVWFSKIRSFAVR